jgi:hypothetical protein
MDNRENRQDRWKPAIQPDEEPTILVREPRRLRRKTINWCRSAAFSASIRIFDLNSEARTARMKHGSSIIPPA